MTLPVACPPASCTALDPPTVPQRKRRRRAPASGALEDCFACSKRNSKCDRRRPYCSQCLEVGKECSGYKTQLTWGVGVASRGKLRGLSLPVARSAPAAKSPPANRPRALSTVQRTEMGDDEVRVKVEALAQIPPSMFTNYDFVNMAPNGAPSQMQAPDWNMAISQDFQLQDYNSDSMDHQRQLPQLHRLHTLSLGRGDGLGLSSSIDSLSAYAESEYAASPISQSFQTEDGPYLHSPVPMYNSFSSRNSATDSPVGGIMGDSRGPTSCPDHFYAQSEMGSSISSHQNLYDIAEGRQHQQSQSQSQSPAANDGRIFYEDELLGGPQNPDTEVYAPSSRSGRFGWNAINDEEVASQTTSETDTFHLSNHDSISPSSYPPDMTRRISFFLDYYEKIICPSLVVLDSPSNPYREHILSLASNSRSLQHAICALSACNLRMKRKQSLGQDHWRQHQELELLDHINYHPPRPFPTRRASSNSMASDPQSSDPSLQEEHQHRSLAVSLLNQQLSDPSQACHDSVLATLFILCHYRMCESGIAQFRTQFAGAKKILGMRESGIETGNWGWMETLFTYFDGITASINDREAQLKGGFLEMIANPSNSNQSLENLAGCDSILFRTIGKLGRLNLLSQHRPVIDEGGLSPTLCADPRPGPPPRPRPGLAGQALVDFYNLHAHSFDGNGFASTLDDESSFPMAEAAATGVDDLRTVFWAEWKGARQALQEWEFDASRLLSILPVTPTTTQLRDFGYLSEAFRYAALLYTERLACPNLPSSHLNFQNLVSQVLYYVTSLEGDSKCEKFLLWPLFVAGSECVNELQQSIVRGRCRGIMGRSGYLNNLAGLEVLERLWGETGERGNGGFRGPFRWTRFMDGEQGEWIMV